MPGSLAVVLGAAYRGPPGGTLRTARGRAGPPTQRWVVNRLGRVLSPFLHDGVGGRMQTSLVERASIHMSPRTDVERGRDQMV